MCNLLHDLVISIEPNADLHDQLRPLHCASQDVVLNFDSDLLQAGLPERKDLEQLLTDHDLGRPADVGPATGSADEFT